MMDIRSAANDLISSFEAFSEFQAIRQYQELIDLELLKMAAFAAAEMTAHRFARA